MPVEPEEVFETPDVEENNLVDIAKVELLLLLRDAWF